MYRITYTAAGGSNSGVEYTIYSDKTPLNEFKLANPTLTMEDCAAGSLSFTVHPNSEAARLIEQVYPEYVRVYKDNKTLPIWLGRVLTSKEDFWKNKAITCEGVLAFLNDTIQPPKEYRNQTIRGWLTTLINNHNQKVSETVKTFKIGAVTVTDPNDSIYRYTNYETTLQCINDKLINRLGGHLRVRIENDGNYIDYLAESPRTSKQVIQFGQNLLDYSKTNDRSNYCTVIVPRGARLDESPIPALEAYTTVASVNGGSIYVYNQITVDQFGWIEKVVDWDDVTVPANLLTKARRYLSDEQFITLELEVTVADLGLLDVNADEFQLLDLIRCVSLPHGMDRFFPLSKMTIPLANPSDTKFTLGDTVRVSLTSSTRSANHSILQRIEELPTRQEVLEEAQDNATAIINQFTSGFVTLRHDGQYGNELLITDTEDYTQATKVWRWNLNGFAYSSNGYNGPYTTAITMNGAIVADFITAGTMSAERILGGTLRLGNYNGKSGELKVYDENGVLVGQWDKTSLMVGKDLTSTTNYPRTILSKNKLEIIGSNSYSTTFESTYSYMRASNSTTSTTAQYLRLGPSMVYFHIPSATNKNTAFYNAHGWNIYKNGTSDLIYEVSIGRFLFGQPNNNVNGYVYGTFKVVGTKNRLVFTKDYGSRLLYCYETATPYFGDIGEGVISEDGYCYIYIDPIFIQTITDTTYHVFIQSYGEGSCFVKKRAPSHFVVEGTPGLSFSWEIKAKQKDYDQARLNDDDIYSSFENAFNNDNTFDPIEQFTNHVQSLKEAREEVMHI